jgi:hypothetical protein
MSYTPFVKPATLALAAILSFGCTFGCTKNHDETRANATSAVDAPAIAETIADFPSLDAKAWVNGAPVSLAESRGKHVVLIEAWHST